MTLRLITGELPGKELDVMDCFRVLLMRERAREHEEIGKREQLYRKIRDRCRFMKPEHEPGDTVDGQMSKR